MDCHEAQILLIPYVMGDLETGTREARRLEAHLASCAVCAREHRAHRETVAFLEKHRAEFAAACRALDQGHDEAETETELPAERLGSGARRREKGHHVTQFRGSWVRKMSVAACFLVGVPIGLLVWGYLREGPVTAPRKSAGARRTLVGDSPEAQIKVMLQTDHGPRRIPAGQLIIADAGPCVGLSINDRHSLLLSAWTALSVEPLEQGGRWGCLVRLQGGEILAAVRHDGLPFVVETPHGQAIITGTTFELQVDRDETILAVAHGSVRFQSHEGCVLVTADQQSRIVGQSAPTAPVLCRALEAAAWATSVWAETRVGVEVGRVEKMDGDEDWVMEPPFPPLLVNLDTLDARVWFAARRDWFRRRFPEVFRLQEALAREGIKLDCPELLAATGSLEQFDWPVDVATGPVSSHRLGGKSLRNIAAACQLDERWWQRHGFDLSAGPPSEDRSVADGLARWRTSLEALFAGGDDDNRVLVTSAAACIYLANTGTLRWLGLRDGRFGSGGDSADAGEDTELMKRLERQISLSWHAYNCFVGLLGANGDSSIFCAQPEREMWMAAILEDIAEIQESMK
jgi:ferric-dicitrate binding protein FerR (iron transport regulator)